MQFNVQVQSGGHGIIEHLYYRLAGIHKKKN